MTIRGVLYAVVATLAIASAAAPSIALHRGGSGAIPGWIGFVTPGPLSGKHAFLSGRCESCHTPIRGVDVAACISCHAPSAADLGKQSTAFHATAGGRCSGCHIEHQGELRPIAMDHASLLQITTVSSGRRFSDRAADQLTADMKAFLGLPKSDPREKAVLDCANCHSNREPHRELFGRACADCHGLASWKIVGFLHPSPASKECAQCHQAPPSHYMGHFAMMDRMIAGQQHASVDQCFLCHRTDSFNDIKGVGWMKHH